MVSEPIIRFRDAAKVFPGGRRRPEVRAVDGVTLDIEAGEIFGVIGYSGAGKSTLVRLINALEKTTSGAVVVGGRDLTGLGESQLREVRAGIGMIFQQFNLLSSRTVAGNVAYPLEVARWAKAEREARVRELLEFVGIADKADVYPSQLSGGQKQRVGIARALATNPRILLADEATSALDPETTRDVLRLLQRVNRELGITVVIITHEMDVVRYACDRVAVMEHGRVVEVGDAYSVFSGPQAAVTQRFVGTSLRDRPSDETLARLRERHPARLVVVGIDEVTGSTRAISQVLRGEGVEPAVIYGGITEVADKPYGSLTFELTGPDDAVDAAVERLRAVTDVDDLGTAAHPRRAPSLAARGRDDAGPGPASLAPTTDRRPGGGPFGGPTGLTEGNL
ncbi:methionine ABC transporter ATP-binding protein [Xylanimonas protaetiae]|uniref:ATP-binding cassette domain-containing protein n=1 Tax=Xylanimonas protaetiae TaxID=2509457 RepID=A0A4P6F1U4_9MICO|nr:ATP-binding cassette domain-containing protein [Xylanimonas protaetiae]QAY69780.1 ATP-binding cassette domain-containing protein [Xylanimonas protaetiae]